MLSKKVIAAVFATAFSATSFASGPMHDTWDINAPNGTPLPATFSASTGPATHVHASATAAPTATVDRVVVIRAGTKYVNVTNGETVLFKVGDKAFARKFDTMVVHGSFDLSDIAPNDVNVQGIRVFCGPSLYERAG